MRHISQQSKTNTASASPKPAHKGLLSSDNPHGYFTRYLISGNPFELTNEDEDHEEDVMATNGVKILKILGKLVPHFTHIFTII